MAQIGVDAQKGLVYGYYSEEVVLPFFLHIIMLLTKSNHSYPRSFSYSAYYALVVIVLCREIVFHRSVVARDTTIGYNQIYTPD